MRDCSWRLVDSGRMCYACGRRAEADERMLIVDDRTTLCVFCVERIAAARDVLSGRVVVGSPVSAASKHAGYLEGYADAMQMTRAWQAVISNLVNAAAAEAEQRLEESRHG